MLDPFEGFLPTLDIPPDPDNDRRDFLKKAGMTGAAVAAATAGGTLLGSPAALADETTEWREPSPENRALLPTIGQTINCTCNAFGATLFVNLPPPLPKLNFIGSIVVRVEIGGVDFVRLRVLNHTVEALHDLFGKITIRLPDIDVNVGSILKLDLTGLITTMLLTFKITFERCGTCIGPFVFDTLQPAELTAKLTEFPPPVQGMNPDGSPTGGALYELTKAIPLGTGATQFAQLQGMNINVGQLLG